MQDSLWQDNSEKTKNKKKNKKKRKFQASLLHSLVYDINAIGNLYLFLSPAMD